jgi:hypothetical protein
MGGGGFRTSGATQAPLLLTISHEAPLKSAFCRFTHLLGNHQKLFCQDDSSSQFTQVFNRVIHRFRGYRWNDLNFNAITTS